MTFKDRLRVRSALLKHQNGKTQEAESLYEGMYRDGVILSAYLLPYSVLLLRSGREGVFQQVREMMVKAQNAPDLTTERRQQLLMNYAITVWKLGDISKAISTLEASHKKQVSSLTYQALGFLYIEAGDKEKALAYNLEAHEYDDEDPITLDNLGQTYFRLLDDRESARPYFEKALKLKPQQIDTLYFLSMYDMDEGKYGQAAEKLQTALKGNFSPLNHANSEKVEAALALAKEKA